MSNASALPLVLVVLYLVQSPAAIAQQRGAIRQPANPQALVAASAGRSPLPSRPTRGGKYQWVPQDIDEFVPPVTPSAACSLPDVLSNAGRKVEELVHNVNRFTATEVVQHQKVDRSGRLRPPETLKFDYLVSIAPTPGGNLKFQEYRNQDASPNRFPDRIATAGTPSMALIFHPRYVGGFHMICEGLGEWDGQPAWQVRFEERSDAPYRISNVVLGGRIHRIRLRGRAWILADSYQVARLQTDLVEPIPEVKLRLQHEDIEYRPVYFPRRQIELWLPWSAELYMDFRGRRFYRRHRFTDFELFSVDVHEEFGHPE